MPDWKLYVREHLKLRDITATREMEIIEDVAQQLDDVYRDALRNGSSESEAVGAAERHIPDWQSFALELSESQRRHQTPRIDRFAPRSESPGSQSFLYEFWRELIYGARTLRRNLRFTLLAAITIALGIGATSASSTEGEERWNQWCPGNGIGIYFTHLIL